MKLICVTNRLLCEEDFLHRIRRIASSGVDAILLREKDLPEAAYRRLAQQCLEICRNTATPLWLNTFVETAVQLQLPVQLPIPVLKTLSQETQHLLPAIGVSVHCPQDAALAASYGASWLIAGHVYPTACKLGLTPRGIPFIRQICETVSIPVYAIGGITADKQNTLRLAGAEGCCVMSHWMQCPNPEAEIQKWRNCH
ncbi:thiamine phosphate synthase [Ruminococcus sp.]|uniref:thiamine phosphate synthase n=1 Tax=Ruminococcus sp. TaxID=41978 RepID=UPI003FF0DF33